MQPVTFPGSDPYQNFSLKKLLAFAEGASSKRELKEIEMACHIRFLEVKASLWKVSSQQSEKKPQLIDELFKIAGEALGVCKIGYHRFVSELKLYKTIHYWKDSKLRSESFDDFPKELAKLYFGKKFIVFPMEALPEHQKEIRELLQSHGEKSLLIAPFSQGIEGTDNALTFCDCQTERDWTAYDRNILDELVKILSSRIGLDQQQRKFRTKVQQFQSFLGNSNEMQFSLSKDGAFSYLSPNSKKITGYAPEELEGQSFTSILHPEDIDVGRRKFDQVMLEGIAYKGNELRFLTKSAGWRWYSINGAPIKDEDSSVSYFLGSAYDITDKIVVQKTLESERKQYQRLIRRIAGAVVILGLDGVIQSVSQGGIEGSGYPEGAVLGRHFLEADFFSPSSHLVLVESFEKAKRGESIHGLEVSLNSADRREKILEIDSVTAEKQILVSIKDITNEKRTEEEFKRAYTEMETGVEERARQLKEINQALKLEVKERKKIESALRSSREMLRLVIDTIPQYIFWKDKERRYLGCNQNFAELTGVSNPEELIGKTDRDLNWPEEVSKHLAICDQRVMSRNLPEYQLTEPRKQKDGREVFYSVNRVPLHDFNGNVIGLLGTYQDITDQLARDHEGLRQERKLMQADRMISLGILSSGIAHEINNPNQFIISNLSPLKRAWHDSMPILEKYAKEYGDFRIGGVSFELLQDRLSKVFENIIAGSQRIKRIVEELKEFNQESPAEFKDRVPFNRVVNSALILLESLIKKSTRQFQVDLTENLPDLKGNYQRLEQVVINLVQNACQALTDQSGKVIIQTLYDEEKRSVVLKVIDEGIGIPEEQRERITDLFFTTKRDMGGVGLGLSISSKIITEHGGKLQITPGLKKGTIVMVYLPIPLEQP